MITIGTFSELNNRVLYLANFADTLEKDNRSLLLKIDTKIINEKPFIDAIIYNDDITIKTTSRILSTTNNETNCTVDFRTFKDVVLASRADADLISIDYDEKSNSILYGSYYNDKVDRDMLQVKSPLINKTPFNEETDIEYMGEFTLNATAMSFVARHFLEEDSIKLRISNGKLGFMKDGFGYEHTSTMYFKDWTSAICNGDYIITIPYEWFNIITSTGDPNDHKLVLYREGTTNYILKLHTLDYDFTVKVDVDSGVEYKVVDPDKMHKFMVVEAELVEKSLYIIKMIAKPKLHEKVTIKPKNAYSAVISYSHPNDVLSVSVEIQGAFLEPELVEREIEFTYLESLFHESSVDAIEIDISEDGFGYNATYENKFFSKTVQM